MRGRPGCRRWRRPRWFVATRCETGAVASRRCAACWPMSRREQLRAQARPSLVVIGTRLCVFAPMASGPWTIGAEHEQRVLCSATATTLGVAPDGQVLHKLRHSSDPQPTVLYRLRPRPRLRWIRPGPSRKRRRSWDTSKKRIPGCTIRDSGFAGGSLREGPATFG